jgi:hypothetical protein
MLVLPKSLKSIRGQGVYLAVEAMEQRPTQRQAIEIKLPITLQAVLILLNPTLDIKQQCPLSHRRFAVLTEGKPLGHKP